MSEALGPMSSPANSILPLTVRDLRFDVGDARLIKDVSFTLTAGPRTAIVGANGAGPNAGCVFRCRALPPVLAPR